MNTDAIYQRLISDAITTGSTITTRNSTVRRIVGRTIEFTSTPLVTIRKTAWKTALREWEWFMSGSCNIDDLHPSVHPWWKPWADPQGWVRNNYSRQFRCFRGHRSTVDQIAAFIDGIKHHPFSRRNVITTWNTADMLHKDTPITNCHGTAIQAFVEPDNSLTIATYQRSVDVICGLPHNWIQYWAFLMWVAHRTGRTVGKLIWVGGDVHVYGEHADLAAEIIDCTPDADSSLLLYRPTSDEFKADDFTLDGPYTPKITTKAVMVV